MAGHEITVDHYTEADGRHVAANMRDMDRKEIYYLAAIDPWRAIDMTAARAVAAWSGKVDGEVACVFGITRRSMISSVGVPWLLATPLVERYPMTIARGSREYFDRMARAFPLMENHVLEENKMAVLWLKWLGFDMEEPRPHGAFGAPFIRFGKGLDQCA
jgi:hypothetical protein